MPEDPRDYDKEFTAPEGGPVRRRTGIDVDQGELIRFVVQLEYLLDPISNEWATVVRYDHDSLGSDEATHDVTEDGVHIDIYRDGEKVDTNELTPPVTVKKALDIVEDHLVEHLEGYVRRFERWQRIKPDDP